MTRTTLFRSAIFYALIFVIGVFVTAAQAQTPQPKNAPVPFMAPAAASQAEQDNFPPQLLEELSAIKTAALSDDYAYHQLAHLTENIGPRIS